MKKLNLAHELEAQATAMNAALSAVYQLMDLDTVDVEPDPYDEEMRLEERSRYLRYERY